MRLTSSLRFCGQRRSQASPSIVDLIVEWLVEPSRPRLLPPAIWEVLLLVLLAMLLPPRWRYLQQMGCL